MQALLAQDTIPRFRISPKYQQYMAAKRQDELESQRVEEKAKKLEAIKKTSQSSPVFAVRAACLCTVSVRLWLCCWRCDAARLGLCLWPD